MQRTLIFTCSDSVQNAWFRVAKAGKIDLAADDSFRIDDRWTLKIDGGKPVRRQQQADWELIIPVVVGSKTTKIELTYDW